MEAIASELDQLKSNFADQEKEIENQKLVIETKELENNVHMENLKNSTIKKANVKVTFKKSEKDEIIVDKEVEDMVLATDHNDRELAPELSTIKKAIEDKNHNYNIITDVDQKTNSIYAKDPSKLDALFKNANKVIFTLKSKAQFQRSNTMNDEQIGPKTSRMELYTEKVTIWEKGILKDILIVIYEHEMSFIFLDKDLFFMKSISILTDIDSFTKSTMKKSYDKHSHDQP